jgi:hypothetical protein
MVTIEAIGLPNLKLVSNIAHSVDEYSDTDGLIASIRRKRATRIDYEYVKAQ